MGCGRRGDDQYKQEIPSSPPGLHRGLERSSGYWLGVIHNNPGKERDNEVNSNVLQLEVKDKGLQTHLSL